MTLKFYTSVTKEFKLKVRKISELIPISVKVTEKKLAGERLFTPILNRVKRFNTLLLTSRINEKDPPLISGCIHVDYFAIIKEYI